MAEKEEILNIYKNYPKHAIKMIFSRQNLKNWAETHCDLSSPNNLTKVYTAVSDQKLLCPCGSGKMRKYYRFHRSLFTKNKLMAPNNPLRDLLESFITENFLNLDKVWDCGQQTWIWRKS